MYKTIVNYTTNNDGYKKNGKLTVKGLMVHSTATPGIMAETFRERFNKPNLGKSVHGFIDDTVYVQTLPYDKKAGHARYSANNTHIGIELCEPKDWTSNKTFFNAVWENSVHLFADLCKKFGLTEKDIISHKEGHAMGIASNHGDPDHWWKYFGKTMNDFRADVKKALAGDAPAPAPAPVPTPTPTETEKDRTKAMQTSLESGLAIDGIIGEHTEKAIKKKMLKKKSPHMKGAFCKWVQKRLKELGYNIGSSGVDGAYGKDTVAAVKAFQKAHGLAQDGIVGFNTITALVA